MCIKRADYTHTPNNQEERALRFTSSIKPNAAGALNVVVQPMIWVSESKIVARKAPGAATRATTLTDS